MLFDTERNKSKEAVMKSAHYSFTLKSYTGDTIIFSIKTTTLCVFFQI